MFDHGTAFGLPTPAENDLAEEISGALPRTGANQVYRLRHRSCDVRGQGGARNHRPAGNRKFEGAYHGAYDYVEVSLDPTSRANPRRSRLRATLRQGTPPRSPTVVVLPSTTRTCAARSSQKSAAARRRLLDPLASRIAMVPARRRSATRCRNSATARHPACPGRGRLLSARRGGAYRRMDSSRTLLPSPRSSAAGCPSAQSPGPPDTCQCLTTRLASRRLPRRHLQRQPLSMTAGLAAQCGTTPRQWPPQPIWAHLLRRLARRGDRPSAVSARKSPEMDPFSACTSRRAASPTIALLIRRRRRRPHLRQIHLAVLKRGISSPPTARARCRLRCRRATSATSQARSPRR